MDKRLVIAEKPSVARDIAEAVGGFEEREEYLEGDDYVITWALGHLLELAEPKEYDKALGSWALKHLPIVPEEFQIRPREGHKKRLALIRKLGNRDDIKGVINACDAGREGEMIYRRIVEYTGLEDLPQQRLWLQSMTPEAIRTALDRLRDGSELDRLADAAWLRAVGDWLIGMNATRALTQRLKSRGERGAWSAGRVQTPTLKMLVNREQEILAHQAEPYWVITADFTDDSATWDGRLWDASLRGHPDRNVRPNRIFDSQRVQQLLAGIQAPCPGRAAEKRRRRRQKPPLPFDLTALQREGNRRFSFSAKRTLDAAQRLYERHKLLTYPRTDSRHLPSDYEATLREVLESLQGELEYQDLAERVAADPKNLEVLLDSSKVSDHFAIVPTGNEPPDSLSSDDAKIYGLVVRQLLASLMGKATWVHVERTVDVKVGEEEVVFRTTARGLEIPGFLEALGKEAVAPSLPPLVAGKDKASDVPVTLTELRSEEKLTRPPGRYSEAALLRMMETAGEKIDDEDLSEAMEGRGIGTPATRASTIEGLIRKGYARRVQGKLAPSSKAMRLMDVLQRVDVPVLGSPRLTGEWEHQLQQVQSGELPRAEMLHQLSDFTRDIVHLLKDFEHDEIYAEDPPLGRCPACGEGDVRENAWGYLCERNTGRDAACRFIIWKDRAGRYIDRRVAEALLEGGRIGPLEGFVDRYGRALTGTAEMVHDKEKDRWILDVQFGEVDEDEDPEVAGDPLFPCPEHEDCRIIETNKRYVCKKLLEGESRKGPVLPKVVCHREIEVDVAEVFFDEPGKTETLEGFISRRGRPFRGALFRKATGKHGFEFPPREPRKKKGSRQGATKKKSAPKKKSGGKKSASKKKKSASKKKTSASKKKKSASKKKKSASKKKDSSPEAQGSGADAGASA